MTTSDQSFGKSYRLCSRKIIDDLFLNGLTAKSFPLIARYHFEELNGATNLQVAISVPKKNFKNAVDRNRIKRLIREAVRSHKNIILEAGYTRQLALFIIYSSKEELPLSAINANTQKLFQKIVSNIEQTR